MRLLLAVCALFVGASPPLLQEGADIKALIQKLGASGIEERDAAMKALVELGEAARPCLEKAAAGADAELAALAKATLARIERHFKSIEPALERIWKDASTSLHRKVRDSMIIVRAACEGQDAEAVEKSLDRQGIPFREEKYRGNLELKFMARPAAYVSPGGIQHDLLILLEKTPRVSKTQPTVWKVTKAGVALVAKPQADFDSLLAKPYPEESLLRRAFDHKSTREQALKFPVVMEIKLLYVLPVDDRAQRLSWAFHVELNLAARDKIRGVLHRCVAKTSLDPDESPTGEKFNDGFERNEAITSLEGGQWGGWGRAAFWSLERVEGASPDKVTQEPKTPVAYGAGDLKGLPETTESLMIQGEKFPVEFDGEGFEDLPRFTHLRSLVWHTRKRIMGDWVELVCRIKTLESLSLVGYGSPTDDDLKLIASLPHLRRLCLAVTSAVTDAGVAHLAKRTELTELNLSGSSLLTDAAMASLSELKNLEKLELWDVDGITDEGIRSLSKLTALKSLVLSQGKRISAGGWSHWEKLQALRTIHLRRLSMNDQGLAVLGRLASLESIQLTELENAGDAGLRALKDLKNLRKLTFWMCPKITLEGLKGLQSELPGKYKID